MFSVRTKTAAAGPLAAASCTFEEGCVDLCGRSLAEDPGVLLHQHLLLHIHMFYRIRTDISARIGSIVVHDHRYAPDPGALSHQSVSCQTYEALAAACCIVKAWVGVVGLLLKALGCCCIATQQILL